MPPVSCLLFIWFLTSLSNGENTLNSKISKETQEITLSFNTTQLLSLPISGDEIIEEIKEIDPRYTYLLNVQFIPKWAQFIVFQAHAYLHNVSLSYNDVKVANKYVTGQNIGLVQNVSTAGTAQMFLENLSPFNVTVLLAVVAYSKSAPVPGGCNLEFSVETSPWLDVNVTEAMVAVSSQPARPPPRGAAVTGSCELPALRYQTYHLYLPEKDFFMDTYFNYLRNMMTAKRIQQNGRKVSDSELGGPMRHVYSAYHGTGSVFAVVVGSSSGAGEYAAYVPALTYTCNPAQYTDSCQVLTSAFSRSLCALVLFIGLFVCFFGHSFFQTELFLLSTLVGSIITFVCIAPIGLTDSTNVLLATVGGVTVGLAWLVLWWATGSPMLSISMATVTLGYLLASIAFYNPLGDVPYMQSNLNYWLMFFCLILSVALLIAPQANRVNILACSIVGAYAAIVPIDHYVGANLKYIFINTIRRATVPGFNEATIDPPFQMKDYLLSGVWVVLAVAGFVTQLQRFGDRPGFPRSPHPWSASQQPRSPRRTQAPLLAEERPLLYAHPVTDTPGADFS